MTADQHVSKHVYFRIRPERVLLFFLIMNGEYVKTGISGIL